MGLPPTPSVSSVLNVVTAPKGLVFLSIIIILVAYGPLIVFLVPMWCSHRGVDKFGRVGELSEHIS